MRLLDIYQRADADKDSLLTRFVKDLLRLDELDALVEGLHDSHHLTRAKNLAPPLRMADDRRRELREKRDAASRRNGEQTAALSVKRQALNDRIAALLSEARMLTDLNALRVRLAEPLEDRQLVAVLQHKRELSSLAREWHTFPSDASADERRALEAEELLASDAAQEWREHSGRELESIIETLREIFPELPSWASTDPEFAHSAAAERVKSEIDRLAATLAVEDANANREGELDQEIGRFDARLKIIDDQVLGLSDTASGLSRALAEIVPHIHSDDCPVCGQDFSKTGKGSLMQHVQAKIASLTEQAGRLAALSTERSQTQTLRSGRAREKAQVAASRLSSADRLALQARMASLAAPAQSLAVIAKQVAVGADILRRQTRAQRRLAELRDRDRRAGEVRSTLSALCATLEQPGLGRSESIEAAFFRIEGHLADKENH